MTKQTKPFSEWTDKEVAYRFFNGDLELCKEIALTKEEVDLFEMFEWEVLCVNGLRQINGGWSAIEILEIDEDDETGNTVLVCKAGCGVQDGGGRELNEWQVRFDRITKKFNKEF